MKLISRLTELALLLTTKPSLQPFPFEMGFFSQNLDLMSQLQWLNTESHCQHWDSRCHCHTGFCVGAGDPNIVPRTCLTHCTGGWTHGLTDAKARDFPCSISPGSWPDILKSSLLFTLSSVLALFLSPCIFNILISLFPVSTTVKIIGHFALYCHSQCLAYERPMYLLNELVLLTPNSSR